jgi:hypothetical protein
MREKPALGLPSPSPKEYFHGGGVFRFWRNGSRGLLGTSTLTPRAGSPIEQATSESDRDRRARWGWATMGAARRTVGVSSFGLTHMLHADGGIACLSCSGSLLPGHRRSSNARRRPGVGAAACQCQLKGMWSHVNRQRDPPIHRE